MPPQDQCLSWGWGSVEEGRGLTGASSRVSVPAVNWLPRMWLKAESGVVSEGGDTSQSAASFRCVGMTGRGVPVTLCSKCFPRDARARTRDGEVRVLSPTRQSQHLGESDCRPARHWPVWPGPFLGWRAGRSGCVGAQCPSGGSCLAQASARACGSGSCTRGSLCGHSVPCPPLTFSLAK